MDLFNMRGTAIRWEYADVSTPMWCRSFVITTDMCMSHGDSVTDIFIDILISID
jgi:hypothetical protein